MDYAWFVPFFSLAVLWNERKRLRESAGSPGALAFLLALPCMALALLGSRGGQVRFELLGFAGLLISSTMAFFGRKCAARVVFPALCLLFCMPLTSSLGLVTVHLRLLSSSIAGGILSCMFDDAVREGNLIMLAETLVDGAPFAIDIANPCSGLRSVFALLALAVCYGYWTLRTWRFRAVLAAVAVPLAVLGNVARILSICVVAKMADGEFAAGFYHDFSGFVVFGVAMAFMVGIGGLLAKVEGIERGEGRKGERVVDEALARPHPLTSSHSIAQSPCCGGRSASAILVAYMALTGFFAWAMLSTPSPVVEAAPTVHLPELSGWESESVEASVAETNLLRGAAIEKRMYRRRVGASFMATVVTSGADKSSMHRPELCLPSQGFDMLGSWTVEEGARRWRIIALGAKGGRGGALFAYTFVNQNGWRTASHAMRIFRDVWDRAVNGRIDRWAMTSVLVPGAGEAELRRILRALSEEGKGGVK